MTIARLFFGVPLMPEATLGLEAVCERLQPQQGWRWVGAQNWHITLSFLGDIENKWINALADLGERVAHESTSGSIVLDSLQWWPSATKPRLLVAVAEQSAPLQPIRKLLNTGMRELGVTFDGKPLRAHVTLLRLERDVLIEDLQLPDCNVAVEAESIALYISEKAQGAKRYRPLWQQVLVYVPPFNH